MLIFTTLLFRGFWLSNHKVWKINGQKDNVVFLHFTTFFKENIKDNFWDADNKMYF